MKKTALFQIAFMAALLAAWPAGFVGRERLGQVMIGLAVIDFAIAFLAWTGLPVLRGDAAGQSPVGPRDAGGPLTPAYAWGMAGLGVLALAVGAALLIR